MVDNNQNLVLKTLLLLNYQKLFTFFVKNPKKKNHFFLCAFIWNHPVFTYFASFTGYEDVIFKVTSNFHVQGSEFGGQFDQFSGKSC